MAYLHRGAALRLALTLVLFLTLSGTANLAQAAGPIRVTTRDFATTLTADPEPTASSVRESIETEARVSVGEERLLSLPVLAEPAAVIGAVIREKPAARPFRNPAAAPRRPQVVPRLDDPILRWLPEIIESSSATGVPAELIAGIMRVESQGDPNVISPSGAHGLMQIMPDLLYGYGLPEGSWHDPKTNILTGAMVLSDRLYQYGDWATAVGSYLGFGCDVYGTCTDVYVTVVFGWASFFAPIIANVENAGFAVLGGDWIPPFIAPYQLELPAPIPSAPISTVTYSPPPAAAPAKPTRTPVPGETGPEAPAPIETPATIPTAVATEVPTEAPPVEIPTEIPVEIPTEVIVEAPVEPPLEVQAEAPVEPATEPVADSESEPSA